MAVWSSTKLFLWAKTEHPFAGCHRVASSSESRSLPGVQAFCCQSQFCHQTSYGGFLGSFHFQFYVGYCMSFRAFSQFPVHAVTLSWAPCLWSYLLLSFSSFCTWCKGRKLGIFQTSSYTNKLNICSLYAQESIKITNKLWQLFHHLLLSSTNWAVETTSVSRSVSGWSPICHQKRSNNETSYSLSFLQEFPPLEIFSLKFKFKESMYIQICLLFTNLSNQAHSTKSIP